MAASYRTPTAQDEVDATVQLVRIMTNGGWKHTKSEVTTRQFPFTRYRKALALLFRPDREPPIYPPSVTPHCLRVHSVPVEIVILLVPLAHCEYETRFLRCLDKWNVKELSKIGLTMDEEANSVLRMCL